MDFDIFFPLRIPLKIMKVFGFWHNKDSSWVFILYGISMHLIFVDVFLALQFGYLFKFETFEDFANLMVLFPTFLSAFIKSLNMFYNINEIRNLIDFIQTILERQKLNENFKSHLKGADRVFKIFWIVALISCAMGVTVPFQAHELPYKMLTLSNYQSNEYLFWISALYQLIVTTSICGAVTVWDTLSVIFMSYIAGMLEHLGERLHALSKADDSMSVEGEMKFTSELKSCVDYQLNILELTRQVEKIFSSVLLAQGLMSTLILCTTSFTLTIVSIKISPGIFTDLA